MPETINNLSYTKIGITETQIISPITNPTLVSVTICNNGTIADLIGTQNLVGGYTWGTIPQSFDIKVNGSAAYTISLTTDQVDADAIVAYLNQLFLDAGIKEGLTNQVIEAYKNTNNYIGLRSINTGDQVIEIVAGGSALATFGWTAGIYEGIDEVQIKTRFIPNGSDFDTAPIIIPDLVLKAGDMKRFYTVHVMKPLESVSAIANISDVCTVSIDAVEFS